MSLTASIDALERLDPVLERLKLLHPKVIDLSLDRVYRLLERLGNPHRRLPPVIHVAGTNGKGSTIAFLRAMLEAAGKRVHVYTSPHLVRFHERIRLAGTLIEDRALIALLEECERANAGEPITYFEITTVAAFLAFSRVPADVVLLETGLGGRLDATNVVEHPVATAITRISYDHRQFLGETLTAIASEKAGIFKTGAPVIIAPQPSEEAFLALAERAKAIGASFVAGGVDWAVRAAPDGFQYQSVRQTLNLPSPALAGVHQFVNAGTAIAVLENSPSLGIGNEAIRKGLAAVEWPARMQRLMHGPLVSMLPQGWELWLDGGHNDSAGEVLAVHLARWAEDDQKAGVVRPVLAIYGMLASKVPQEFLAPLAACVTALRTVPIPGEEASLTAEDAAQAAMSVGFANVSATGSVAKALSGLTSQGSAYPVPPRVLICGSLYLAGAVLAQNS